MSHRAVALSVAAVLLGAPGAGSQPALEACSLDVGRAASFMDDARWSHEAWLAYLRSGRATPVERRIGGDEAFHAMWVERYDFTIRVLRQRCREVS